MAKVITRERAERIVRSHACEHCQEYSFKKLVVKPATAMNKAEFNETWHAVRTCGVCGHQEEIGIDGEGDIVYVA